MTRAWSWEGADGKSGVVRDGLVDVERDAVHHFDECDARLVLAQAKRQGLLDSGLLGTRQLLAGLLDEARNLCGCTGQWRGTMARQRAEIGTGGGQRGCQGRVGGQCVWRRGGKARGSSPLASSLACMRHAEHVRLAAAAAVAARTIHLVRTALSVVVCILGEEFVDTTRDRMARLFGASVR